MGRKQKYEQLHLESIMPANLLAQHYNYSPQRNPDSPPRTEKDYLVFQKMAYPEEEQKFSDKLVATIQAIAAGPHPQWIHGCLPWLQLLNTRTKAEPSHPLMAVGANLVIFAPQFVEGWVFVEMAAFLVAKHEINTVITLYDPETKDPMMDVQLKDDVGQGYYKDEKFKILKVYEKEVAHA
jgi:hypothetical protein